MRFTELERSLEGISPKTLSERLKSLERSGILSRTPVAENSGRNAYALTEKGSALLPIVEVMRAFGETWI